MRVHLDNPALLGSLRDHLRQRNCVVEQVSVETLAVWCAPAGLRSGDSELTCRSCGTPIAEALGRLGSLRCHDCRDDGRHETLLAGVYARANGNGQVRRAREQLAAHVADWQAENPDARASVID
jgi:hypothetical protein